MAQQSAGRSTLVESSFHQFLKEVASDELEKEGYNLYVEPSEPPEERLEWRSYRPDILGLMRTQTMLSLVLVECGTNPRMSRISRKISKIRRSFVAQKRLNEDHLLRLLLVIPPGMLHRVVNPKIRRTWEIWIVNKSGNIIHKIPQLES